MNIVRYILKIMKERELTAFYKSFINKGDLCFDIGANVGEVTDVMMKMGAAVIAVEPQESCLKILRKKYEGNRQVTVVDRAVGSIEKEDDLMICEETAEASTLSALFAATYSPVSRLHYHTTERVKVTTLEQLILQHGVPHFCKIDVEGYESEVFKGLKTPIRFISFEFNNLLLSDTLNCLTLLSALAPYQCNFIVYEHMKTVLPDWLEIDDFNMQLEDLIGQDVLTGEIIAQLKISS